jgi:hypothetical protein
MLIGLHIYPMIRQSLTRFDLIMHVVDKLSMNRCGPTPGGPWPSRRAGREQTKRKFVPLSGRLTIANAIAVGGQALGNKDRLFFLECS